jgi:hypothetical protein
VLNIPNERNASVIRLQANALHDLLLAPRNLNACVSTNAEEMSKDRRVTVLALLIWNDLSTRNSVLSFFFHSCSSQEAAQVAVGEAITTIDHSDIRGSEPHNRDPSGAASD